MGERRLYLVRHAQVTPVERLPSREWPLTVEGRRTAERLGQAPAWRDVRLVASSPEPKALDTARPIARAAGVELTIDLALREVGRAANPIVGADEYRAIVAAFFASPQASVRGWERAHDAQVRVRGAVDRRVREADGSLAVVSHGLALSLLLASLAGKATVDVEAWAAIALPAVAIVDPETSRVLSPFESAASFLARR